MHVELKEKNINLLVDFDSTFVTVETIDEISKLSCERGSAEKIEKITIKAMEGKISFQEALSNRIKIINKLYDEGNTIIFFTARGYVTKIDWRELTLNQLDEWNVKYHELILGKPHADIYVDDKAIKDLDFFND